MTTINTVSVLVVSWNGREHLEHLLPALRTQRDPGVEWELLLLDNGSSDGTREWVESSHPWVKLVQSPSNLGFCGGNNRLAHVSNADALVLLNNDTRPREDWLAALVEALRAAPPDVAAVSGLIVDWEAERLDFAQGVMTFDGHAFQFGFGEPLSEMRIPRAGSELLFPCGGNLIVRRDSFLEAGGFDDGYFAYLEDVDLGWRLWAGGERVLFSPDAAVRHRSMATSDRLGHQNRGTLFERNAFVTAFKNYDDELRARLLPSIFLAFLSRSQALLTQHNPGGDLLALDPYAGLIADTGASSPRATGMSRIRELGIRGTARKVLSRLKRRLRGLPTGVPSITDERTVAQIRALSFVLGRLDALEEQRRQLQSRRTRPDREIFERFPLHVIPTYPGDEQLFASSAFRALLPEELPVRYLALDDVMRL